MYLFSCSLTQNVHRRRPTMVDMVADIFEDHEPLSKNFLATPLKTCKDCKFKRKCNLEMKVYFLRYSRQGIVDNLTKLSKICFSVESFPGGFSRFFGPKCPNLPFEWSAGYSQSNPSTLEFFLKFPNFRRSKFSVVWQLVRQFACTFTFC